MPDDPSVAGSPHAGRGALDRSTLGGNGVAPATVGGAATVSDVNDAAGGIAVRHFVGYQYDTET